MACDSIQSCTSLLGSALGDTSFEGGVVKNRMACKFSASDTSYKLICHRYGKATSVNGKGETCKNIMGVIYEYNTGSILCYTIENEDKYKNNLPDGIYEIVPGGDKWPSKQDYCKGCSSYTVYLAQGKGGFGKTAGAPKTMLANSGSGTNGGCLFHPGGDASWSDGCVLIGAKADSAGKRVCNSIEFTEEKIKTSTDNSVRAYRNFYNIVVPKIANGQKVKIQYVTNFSQQPKIEYTGPSLNGKNTKLVSLGKALTEAGFVYGTDYDMPLPYSTSQNFLKQKIDGYKAGQIDCYASPTMAKAMVKAAKYMKKHYNDKYMFSIMDCYRPQKAAMSMWNVASENYKEKASTYVAKPGSDGKSKSKHCRGTAIDLTLKNKSDKQFVNMNAGPGTGPTGSGFDEFSKKAKYDEKNANQKMLNTIMCEGGGLTAYIDEWWHFQSGGDCLNETIAYD
jgi:D-alanyl-D-alanine dipeptidase